MLNRFKIITVLFLLLGFGLAAIEARAAGSITLNSLNGTVYVIDTTAKTVTLKDAGGALTTLNLTRSSKILRNGKKVTLTGLVLGDQVTALFDGSKNVR